MPQKQVRFDEENIKRLGKKGTSEDDADSAFKKLLDQDDDIRRCLKCKEPETDELKELKEIWTKKLKDENELLKKGITERDELIKKLEDAIRKSIQITHQEINQIKRKEEEED